MGGNKDAATNGSQTAASGVKTPESAGRISPFRLALIISLSILIGETVVMYGLSVFAPSATHWVEAILDAVLLTILILPVLYFFHFNPLMKNLANLERTESALAEKSAYLDSMLRSSTDMAIAATDLDFRITYYNKVAEKMFGYTAEEVIGRTVMQMHTLEKVDHSRFERAIEKVRKDGEYRYNLRQEKEWGVRHLESRVSGIWDKSGELTGFVLMSRDVTKRQLAEDGLKESHERLLTALNSLDAAIFVEDMATHEIIFTNRRLGELFGDITGKPCWQTVHAGGGETCSYCEDNHLLVGTGRAWEFRNAINNRWYDVRDRAIQWVDGRVVKLEIATDITQRKMAEENSRKLEAKVLQAQKLESLGLLAGGIAHDFNNLLVGILGNADLALTELPNVSPARESVREIENAAVRASDLCRQLLAYSGKGKFVIEPFNLNEVVEEMTHLLEVSKSKNVTIRYEFTGGLPSIEGDITQIRQVIMNLITNASEAIGSKRGVITISTGSMECDLAYLREMAMDEILPEGRYVFLEISDTGAGMDEETKSRIFDPFFSTKFSGRGLGLAAALGIVRGHKGTLKVYSEPGKGTTFKALFPAVDKEARSLAKAEVKYDFAGSGLIMLVDDDESVRNVGKRQFAKLGFNVITAATGAEALDIYGKRHGEIALIMLDLTMPDMDGTETFRELRRINPSAKVVLTSGYNEQDSINRFTGKGLAGFIQKPYRLADLTARIKEVLGK